jgi:hypothetical protein
VKTIHKYPLAVVDRQSISMPHDADVLAVHLQYGAPCLWALVDTQEPLEPRAFVIVGTGHDLSGNWACQGAYRGTFQLHDGAIVLHVFEES